MRILVVDDHPLFRDGLISLLEAAGYEIVGQAEDGEAAITAVDKLNPDLVLLDLKMPGMDGITTLRRLKSTNAGLWVVVLTVSEDDADLFAAIEAGADGYLQKNLNATQFMDLLEGLEHGDAAITRKTAARLMAGIARTPHTPKSDAHMTPREKEILALVAEGMTNRKIAQKLSVSENTVKYHLRNIMQKLGAQNRTEAVTIAIQSGFLEGSNQRN
ncbi:MAG: response regulator transcription factor [Anaerolineales bacterium]|nr:response regulator transcription factor [Anaerolineales bacterium]